MLLLLIPIACLAIVCLLEMQSNREKDLVIKIQDERFRELLKKYRELKYGNK